MTRDTLTDMLKHLRIGLRGLARDSRLTVTAVLALTLGIGLTTMTFSIVYGALYRGLPFKDSDRLLHLERSNLPAGIESMGVSIHDFWDWRENQTTFQDLAAFAMETVYLSGEERSDRYDGAFITPSAFGMLGVRPLLGRTLGEADAAPGAPLAVVVGERLWQEHFGGDPNVVGRAVRVNGEPGTVVGVMPERFRFPVLQDVWVPLKDRPSGVARGEGRELQVFGRLRDGITPEAAARDIAGIARRLELEYPVSNEGIGSVVKPYVREFMGDDNYFLGALMLAAVFLVLLVACANVANLLLTRAAGRTREIGVRAAMGASRLRIVGQSLTEAFAIALAGAVLGMVIATVGVRWFRGVMNQVAAPFWIDIRLDGPSLLFVVVTAFVAAAIAGGLPAWQSSRADVAGILNDESRGSSSFWIGRLSRSIVVFEVALSFGLLVAAGLLVKSVVKLDHVPYVFSREAVFTARIGIMDGDYPTAADRVKFFQELTDGLVAVPGAKAAALTTTLPGFYAPGVRFGVEGQSYQRDADYPLTRYIAVSPGFLGTFEVEPVQGRGIQTWDRDGSLPVAVVNESFARRYLDGSPLRKRVRVGNAASGNPWLTVVGVIPDLHASGPQDEAPEALYIPLAQSPEPLVSIAVRTTGAPASITASVRDMIGAIDPNLPLFWVGPLDTRLDEEYWPWRTFGTLFLTFGLAALLLAAIGVYSVIAFAVSTRTRELGVRMAVGARSTDIVWMVARQGTMQLALGLSLGLGVAVLLGHALTRFLFDVQPRDPAVFGGILGLFVVIGLAASLIPAWRATRVDPVEALR